MSKSITTFLLLLVVSGGTFAAGWTPFIPPPPVPEVGVPFLKDDPAYPKYLEIYGEIQENYATSIEVVRAGRAISQLQKDFPSSPYPFFALAEYKYMISAMNGDTNNPNAEINAILDRVMRENGANLPDGYILQAKMAANRYQGKTALDLATVAVKFAPNKPESQFVLARAADISKQYAKAEEAYKKFIALESSSKRRANIYHWLGVMYSNLNRTRADRAANRMKAKEAFRLSAELAPTNRHTNTYAIFLLTDTGDAEAANPYFSHMLQQDQHDEMGNFFFGLTEYLKWAKANPNGGSNATLNAIEKRTGLKKEDAFVVSALYDGLADIPSAILRSKSVKNIDVVCTSVCENINAMCTDSCVSLTSSSAIVNAAYSDNVALIKELVEHGANVNARGSGGMTPLMYALYNDNANLLAYLLKRGARVNVAAEDGITPMAIAVKLSPVSRQLVRLLLKYKADPMGVDGSGQPIAFAAVMADNLDALDALITEGKVDVNLSNSEHLNLLFYALDNPNLVRLLLLRGANPWQQAGNGDLLDWARSKPQQTSEIVQTIALLEEARRKSPKK